jgi:thiamine-monophosphate kinase
MPAPTGEFSLIDWIRERSRGHSAGPVGIGDDAALVWSSANGVLVTTDMLMDGVDFDVQTTSHELIGRKCLAVNLSDIAAMAGRPLAAFVSLALPRHDGRTLAEELYRGMWPLAAEYDVAIAGGDTNTWDGPLVVNVTVLGEPPAGGPVLRSGGQSGDLLFVTGSLGGSIGGRHLSFTPRVREAERLRELVELHAMIDLSDGLASDVRHLTNESDVGVVIDADRIPIHNDVDPNLPPSERIRHALSDGEDFELLFTVSADDGAKLLSRTHLDVQVTCIGEVIDGHDCFLRRADGTLQPLPRGGWEHPLD